MKIAIIGCGVIGSALARHFSRKHQVIVFDRNDHKSAALALELGVQAAAQPAEALEKTDLIVLAVKPKDLTAFAQASAGLFTQKQMLVSVLAGTSVALLKHHFPDPLIVRAMPNLPMTCGEGIVGFVNTPEITAAKKKRIETLFKGLGLLCWLSEDHLEALSAVAGSGPAFVFVFIEAMIASGILLGFSPHQARDLVLKTLEGSVALLRATAAEPLVLKAQVASPGGTTMAGLKVLEENEFRRILMDAIQATFLRARELQN